MDDDLQLDLFTWDRVKTGEGFRALAALDFEKAKGIFDEVLARWPGHPDASAGFRMAADWSAILTRADALHGEEAIAALCEGAGSYPFAERGEALRRAVLRRAIALAADDGNYIGPGLCLGHLWLELQDYGRAEEAFNRLLERYPRDGRLLVCLGTCLLRQGKKDDARFCYAKALLLAPWELECEELEDAELRAAIADEDLYSAAICGWLRGVLPFVEVDATSPHDRKHEDALAVYRAVGHAEQARAKGAHEEMVAQRRRLKQLAPTVFVEYMRRA